MELEGKVALVTGAGNGIGEQAALKLSAAGAHVVISDIDGDKAQAAAAKLPGVATTHVGDLTKAGVAEATVTTAIEAFGKLDIVVNNAGYAWDAPLHKVTDAQFQAMLDIHTVVPFRVLRAASPYLRDPAKADAAAGKEYFRKVVNVSSLSGVMGNAGQVAYAAAKAGQVGLTKALAKEWGPLKINVNAVAFGFIDTQLTEAVPAPLRAAAAQLTPLGRAASPDEAARGIYFLCSPLSDYVHGQVLAVSGGLQFGMTS